MNAKVKLKAIIEGIEMQTEMSTMYLDIKTGKLETIFDEEFWNITGEPESGYFELEEKVLGNPEYISLPSEFDVNEYNIMEEFSHSLKDEKIKNQLLTVIKGKGAFRKFKDKLLELGIREDWFKFKEEALKEIAIEWCKVNEIPFEE